MNVWQNAAMVLIRAKKSYERIFVYEDGTLIFAYLKEDGNESRLYYKDDNIFRWSYPKNTDIHDNDFENPEFIQNGMDGRTLGYELYSKATGQTKSFGTGSLSDEIVYQKLVEYYKNGTEDSSEK